MLARRSATTALNHHFMQDTTLVDEMLERMTDNSVAVIPVMERGTDRFLGSVTSQDVMDLVVLMHQIDDEVQRRAEDAASESPVH